MTDTTYTPEQRAANDLFGSLSSKPQHPEYEFFNIDAGGKTERVTYNDLVARYRAEDEKAAS